MDWDREWGQGQGRGRCGLLPRHAALPWRGPLGTPPPPRSRVCAQRRRSWDEQHPGVSLGPVREPGARQPHPGVSHPRGAPGAQGKRGTPHPPRVISSGPTLKGQLLAVSTLPSHPPVPSPGQSRHGPWHRGCKKVAVRSPHRYRPARTPGKRLPPRATRHRGPVAPHPRLMPRCRCAPSLPGWQEGRTDGWRDRPMGKKEGAERGEERRDAPCEGSGAARRDLGGGSFCCSGRSHQPEHSAGHV